MSQRKVASIGTLFLCGLLSAVTVVLAGCGSSNEAVCGGSPMKESVDLPIHWPSLNKLTYTKQEKNPPNFVVDGYFNDGLRAAHDQWKKALQAEGFTIRSDELGDHDSELSWRGEASSGQVAIHQACGSSRRVWIHITSRTA
jgi:hypothetical protein